ncbi:MAG: hypothetical protein ACXWBN_10010, partial [Acidimicrobiales bacterium]
RNATFRRDDTHWHWWPPGTDPTTTPPLTAPIGHHLATWSLDHLPDDDHDPPAPNVDRGPPTLDLG